MKLRFHFLISIFLILFIPQQIFAHPGAGIVQDSKGNVFYTDLVHIWKISPSGSKSIAVKNVHSHELYLDSNDNLFGENVRYEGEKTDRYYHRIWKRSPDGKVTDVVKEKLGFRDDLGFVRDSKGNQYWIHFALKTPDIRKRAASGEISTIKTDKPLGHLSYLSVSADGQFIYVGSSKGFYKISQAGKTTALFQNAQEKNHTIFGSFPVEDGSVYVADFGQKSIKKVDKSGAINVVARSVAPWAPSGVYVASNKDLWILEYSTNNEARIRKVDTKGKETIF